MDIHARTEVGLVREQNEDNYLICPERKLLVVADGMGGHLAGEVASRLAIQVFDERIRVLDGQLDPKALLRDVTLEANKKILHYAELYSECHGMGTTLTAALVYQDRVFLAHVGDSRAYLIRNDRIDQITIDHSVVEELLRQGIISKAEAFEHPYKNVLTRALGISPEIEVDLIEEPFNYGDYLLLCTDGLTNLLVDQEIYDIVMRFQDTDKSLEQMINLALARGGYDNITVAMLRAEYRGETS